MSGSEARTLTPASLRAWPLPDPDGDKSSRGTVLVVGGARATPGAVLLAGTGAMRAGAGKLQLATVESVTTALGIAVPEAMVIGLRETERGAVSRDLPEALLDVLPKADVVVVGPGLVDVEESEAVLASVLEHVADDAAVVIDAYALAALARSPQLVEGRSSWPVLTPNVGEGAQLLGRDLGDDLVAEALEIARTCRCVVSLFGHVADPDGNAWHDETADSGLGTSGSGDVAAGLAAGLLARGAEPAQAACWAVHVHAAAGQRLAVEHGRTSYLAREIVDGIAPALAALTV